MATTLPTKKPHGIFMLDNPRGYTSMATDGERVRFAWPDFEPEKDVYDWSRLDSALALAQENGKQIGASIGMLAYPPAWLLEAGATLYDLPIQLDGDKRSIVVGWDTIVKQRIRLFNKALCERYDGKLDYIAMGGLGCVIESYLAVDPTPFNLTLEEALAKWGESCNAIIDVHARNLKQTSFIFTAAKAFTNQSAGVALDTLVRAAAAKYPGRFGVMNCSLASQSSTGYIPHRLVNDLSATNPCGLQFLTSSVGFKGHDIGGTLQEALESAIELKAQWVECYPYDVNNPANVALFRDISARLPT
jgi:hypothetical protein